MARLLSAMARMRILPALLCVLALAFAKAAVAQAQLKTKPYESMQATYDRSVENDPALKARIETIRALMTASRLTRTTMC